MSRTPQIYAGYREIEIEGLISGDEDGLARPARLSKAGSKTL